MTATTTCSCTGRARDRTRKLTDPPIGTPSPPRRLRRPRRQRRPPRNQESHPWRSRLRREAHLRRHPHPPAPIPPPPMATRPPPQKPNTASGTPSAPSSQPASSVASTTSTCAPARRCSTSVPRAEHLSPTLLILSARLDECTLLSSHIAVDGT